MKEVIDFKIGDEYKEGDILKTREGVYLLVEKRLTKIALNVVIRVGFKMHLGTHVYKWIAPQEIFILDRFETYKEGEEYNVGDLLKIPKPGEPGKFILSNSSRG